MENNKLALRTKCRTSLITITDDEKQLIKSVNSIDDLLAVRSELATITSLRIENPGLANAFVATNMVYICSILNIELNPAQQADMIDELGQVGWLTMADFKLFLDRMKKHKFFRRDYQELLVEFWRYADDRLERAFEIESAKVDKSDFLPRTGETNHIRDLNIFKIKQGLSE
jgi:hypothetical protein